MLPVSCLSKIIRLYLSLGMICMSPEKHNMSHTVGEVLHLVFFTASYLEYFRPTEKLK